MSENSAVLLWCYLTHPVVDIFFSHSLRNQLLTGPSWH